MSHNSKNIEEHEGMPESKKRAPRARPGDVLLSLSHRYEVIEFLGRGTFGQVLKCTDEEGRQVAIKMLAQNPEQDQQGQIEFDILTVVAGEKSDNFVRVEEYFKFENKSCLVFECLDQSLSSFHKDYCRQPLPVPWIRTMLRQLLTALRKLKAIGLIHLDLKPQNIMLTNHTQRPFHVKIIDFGSAEEVKKGRKVLYAQTRFYRSPEILLGTECTTAVDIWSLGCIAAELLLGTPLFPGSCEYYQMRYIVEALGLPAERMLEEGTNTGKFFHRDDNNRSAPWRLRKLGEYRGVLSPEFERHDLRGLDDIRDVPTSDDIEEDDVLVYTADIDEFVDILKRMLALDPHDRITPSEALEHPFITLDHMAKYSDSVYIRDSMTTLYLNIDKDDDTWKPESMNVKQEISQQIHFEDIDTLNEEVVLNPGGEPIELEAEYGDDSEETISLHYGSVEDKASQSSPLGEQSSKDYSSGEDESIIIITGKEGGAEHGEENIDEEDNARKEIGSFSSPSIDSDSPSGEDSYSTITDNEDEYVYAEGSEGEIDEEDNDEGEFDSFSRPSIESLLRNSEAMQMTSEDSASGEDSPSDESLSIVVITDSEDEEYSHAENSEGGIDEEENDEEEIEVDENEEVESEVIDGEPIDSNEYPYIDNRKVITLPIHFHPSIRDQERVEDSHVSFLQGSVDSFSSRGIESLLIIPETMQMTSEDSASGGDSPSDENLLIVVITDNEDEEYSHAENSEEGIDEEKNVEEKIEVDENEEVESEVIVGEPIDSDEYPVNNNHPSIRDQEAVEDSSHVSFLQGSVEEPQMHLSRAEKRAREKSVSDDDESTHFISNVENDAESEGSSTNNNLVKTNNPNGNLPKRFKNNHFMGFSELKDNT